MALPVTVGVAVVAAAGLAGPMPCEREGTLLLLLLRVPAGNMVYQAEAEPAVAESSTFPD